MKACTKCKKEYENPEGIFVRDRLRKDGYSYTCIFCRREDFRRWYQRKKENLNAKISTRRVKAREAAKAKYRGQVFKCAVINCNEMAVHLHHVDYDKPLDIVPLCKPHHHGIHRLEIERQ